MKKIALLLGVAALCGMTQAATLAWKNLGPIIDGYTGSPTGPIASGSVYLIDGLAANGGIAADALWSQLYNGTKSFDALMSQYAINTGTLGANSAITAGSATGSTLTDGAVKWTPTNPNGGTYANEAATSFYQVIRVGGQDTADGFAYFFSEALTPDVNGTGDTKYFFANTGSQTGGITTSLDLGTGWMAVNATAVPEPTSGLLMLVGLSLLGLRRKPRA